MNNFIFSMIMLGIAFTTGSKAAEADYCKLENAPAVQTALKQALVDVNAASLGVGLTGEVQQIPVSGMGDAFDFWGTDLLVFRLDGLAKGNRLSVGVRVTYSSFYAKEYVESEQGSGGIRQKFVCADTGEVNPERIYIDSDSSKIEARPVQL